MSAPVLVLETVLRFSSIELWVHLAMHTAWLALACQGSSVHAYEFLEDLTLHVPCNSTVTTVLIHNYHDQSYLNKAMTK